MWTAIWMSILGGLTVLHISFVFVSNPTVVESSKSYHF